MLVFKDEEDLRQKSGPRLALCDWGLSKRKEADHSLSTQLGCGSLGWMHPAGNIASDFGTACRHDLFSLGLLVYFLQTGGRHVFDPEDAETETPSVRSKRRQVCIDKFFAAHASTAVDSPDRAKLDDELFEILSCPFFSADNAFVPQPLIQSEAVELLMLLLVGSATDAPSARACRYFQPPVEGGDNWIPAGALEVSKELGIGASCTVYRGRWNSLDVAVKVFTTEVEVADRERETRILRDIRHPAIVQYLGWSRSVSLPSGRSGPFCIITELASWSLDHCLYGRKAPLTEQRRLALAVQYSQALGHLHSLGVVHRDIKPGNLLVFAWGGGKLCDLGLARYGNRERDSGGTWQYSAPEILVEQASYSKSADIWSLGVVLWELFGCENSGAKYRYVSKRPFGNVHCPPDGVSRYQAVAVLERTSPVELFPLPECPLPEIAELVQQMLCREPKSRPTIEAVLAVVRRSLDETRGRQRASKIAAE